MTMLIIWLVCGIAGAVIGDQRDQRLRGALWGFLGSFVGLFIYVLIMPKRSESDRS